MFKRKVDKLQDSITKLMAKQGLRRVYGGDDIIASSCFYENACTEVNMEILSDRITKLNNKVDLILDYLEVSVKNKSEESYPKIVKNKKK